MLLKHLMKKEFIEHPELWVKESDGYLMVKGYGRQLIMNVLFAVCGIDWTNEDTIKEYANMLGWKYIAHEYMYGVGLITLEAFLEPHEHSPFKLKCGALVSVYILGDEVCDILTGPIMLYFPNGEKREIDEVSWDYQTGNLDLLKECINIEEMEILSTDRPSPHCMEMFEKSKHVL